MSFLSKNESTNGPDLTDYFTAGNYLLDLSFTDLSITDADNGKFTQIQSAFAVTEDPGVTAYIEDAYVSEGQSNANLTVQLSRAATSDVSIAYATANDSASSSDFTAASGTLSISKGSDSGSITVPLTNDTTGEAVESFSLGLSSATGAALGRASAKITLIDNEAVLSNTTALDETLNFTTDLIEEYLTQGMRKILDTSTLNIGGVNKSYTTILTEYEKVSDMDSWIAANLTPTRLALKWP